LGARITPIQGKAQQSTYRLDKRLQTQQPWLIVISYQVYRSDSTTGCQLPKSMPTLSHTNKTWFWDRRQEITTFWNQR